MITEGRSWRENIKEYHLFKIPISPLQGVDSTHNELTNDLTGV